MYTSTAASCCTVHSDWFAGVLLPLSTLQLCRILRKLVMHMLNRLPWGLKHTQMMSRHLPVRQQKGAHIDQELPLPSTDVQQPIGTPTHKSRI
jgi:hypothetical protein